MRKITASPEIGRETLRYFLCPSGEALLLDIVRKHFGTLSKMASLPRAAGFDAEKLIFEPTARICLDAKGLPMYDGTPLLRVAYQGFGINETNPNPRVFHLMLVPDSRTVVDAQNIVQKLYLGFILGTEVWPSRTFEPAVIVADNIIIDFGGGE